MRVRGIQFQQLLLGLALVAALLWNLAQAGELGGLQLAAGATGTRAELRLATESDFKVISLAGPDRLVVDLPGVTLAKGFQPPAAAGLVKAVRSGQPVPGTTRIVFDLASPVVVLTPRFEPGADGPRLVLEWPGDHGPIAAPAVAANAPLPPVAIPPAAAAPPPPPAIDPAAASASATSKLIAAMPRPTPTPTPAASSVAATSMSASTVNAPSSGSDPRTDATGASAPPPAATTARIPVATTIATGVPTRIATGVPTLTPAGAARARAAAAAAAESQPDMPAAGSTMRPGMRPLVIAIDAGHGGQDPGAVGPTGKREKDITLAIARELARQIDATPGLKSFLTRSGDTFIPLERRAQLARTAKADMFISIHADAAPNRNAKGSSVYVLSLKGASSQRARWLADKENAADLIGGATMQRSDSTLTNVLLDLTQSGRMKASEDAGNHILSGLKRIGNNHKPHIERANFAVLRTSDMPAMLVETAFLSNAEEEQRLIDPVFQRTVARAVLDGVNTYFTSQPPPGTLFAARAAGGQGASSASGGSP